MDFHGSLPTGPDSPAPAPVNLQLETWHHIRLGIIDLFHDCLSGRGLPGWTSVSENIIVAFWPENSLMNQDYGVNDATNFKISNQPNLAFNMTADTLEKRE